MRYTIEEIRQMPEGQTFDCKSIHIEPKALANTIVAMANADGGMIAVGISDKTRRIEGIDQDKAECLKAYDYVKEFGEGVDRMCRELSAIGTKEPQYHLVAFIMKASVWANVLEEGQEKARERQESIPNDQAEGGTTQKLPKNYPETTRKQEIDITPARKGIIDFLLLHPYAGRKEISSNIGSLSEDGVKYNLKVLQQKGIIKRIGPANGRYWKVLSDEEIN